MSGLPCNQIPKFEGSFLPRASIGRLSRPLDALPTRGQVIRCFFSFPQPMTPEHTSLVGNNRYSLSLVPVLYLSRTEVSVGIKLLSGGGCSKTLPLPASKHRFPAAMSRRREMARTNSKMLHSTTKYLIIFLLRSAT